MDAIGRIAQTAERAKAGGRYPLALAGGKSVVNGMALEYVAYETGVRYVVTAQGSARAGAAFLNCARLSGGSPEEREQHHLYSPASQAKGVFFIAYAPFVGLYLVPPPDTRGGVRVDISLEPEPNAPPAEPFAERVPPACPAGSKPVADALIAAVRAARDAQRNGSQIASTDVADVVARGGANGGWLELTPHDGFAQTAALQCLHVAGIQRAHLAAAGIADARRPGSLGFAERFGFYVVAIPGEPSP
jgi:hypothetical protein